MSVRISKTNSKLGVIPSVNIPPVVSCRKNAPCSGKCYAMRGRFRYPIVREAMENNLNIYKEDPRRYFSEIQSAISDGIVSYSYFRWHAAGDIVDDEYLRGMVRVALNLPSTQFLAFTKKYEMINDYVRAGNAIPSNLNIVFSAWGQLKFDNPYNFPVAYVRFKDPVSNMNIPRDAEECSGNCTTCLKCWEIGRGESVVFNIH